MIRTFALLLHRYLGLATSAFLVVVGLTGAVIAFGDPLEAWLAPGLHVVADPSAPQLDPFALREQAERIEPRWRVDWVDFTREPGRTCRINGEPRIDPATDAAYEPPLGQYDQLILDPCTGRKLGVRSYEHLDWSPASMIPCIHYLHDELALGSHGGQILGFAALLWTIDCFVGFYLTLPRLRRPSLDAWWRCWRPAWRIARTGGPFRLTFDLHRALSLWLWLMLLVYAWSSVGMNLHDEVFSPVMSAVFGGAEPVPPAPARALEHPALDWRAAHATGRRLMADQAARRGLIVAKELYLHLDRSAGAYVYAVRATADPSDWLETTVAFDPDTGALVRFATPADASWNERLSLWLTMLHMAGIGGTPYRILVVVVGLALGVVSATGVMIWWRKRRMRQGLTPSSSDPRRS